MGQIRWTVTALADLENIANYIAKDSPYYAVEFVERLIKHVESLSTLPRRGRVVPEFAQSDLREIIFHNYRVVYALKRTTVSIVSISHASIDIKRKMEKEKWIVR